MQITDFWLVFYWFLLATVFLRVLFKRRTVGASLAWILIIAFLPLIGLVLYFSFGEIQLGGKRAERAQAMRDPFIQNLSNQLSGHSPSPPKSSAAKAVYALMERYLGTGALGYHALDVFSEPNDIFDQWLADIKSAKHSIRATFYIWHPQGRVLEIIDALIAAQQRGVKVEILVDNVGSWRFFLFKSHLNRMREAGIQVEAALPVFLGRSIFRRADLRMHRKLFIIDHKIAYSGSMNMADPRFFNVGRNVGPWIDMVIRFEGAAAFGVSKIFSWDWEVETGERRFPKLKEPIAQSEQWLTMIPSGPDLGSDVISQVMLASIYRAERTIMVSSPYFVPSESLCDALCHAAQRGVEVTLLLPEKCDSILAGWASRSFYSVLLEAGVNIRLFQKGLLHTKALVIDEQIAIVGSVNLDMRSLQLNFELSFALYNETSCKKVSALLHHYKNDSVAVDAGKWRNRGRLSRLAERVTYFVSPLL
ncbi:cardiolipin synthase [Aliidiomarina celeris]|uniref:cardiolipin synthase n=1 Tax=Aliidiomarina celeris TaxID=2249428 RepID=UPI0013008C69|nr:cardiolipin synthase [Aliidiomarina celeris]